MERWIGKVAVVTGAASGIGLAITKRFIREGLTVVGIDIQMEKMLDEMKSVEGPGKFFARECDVSKEKDVDETFNYVKKNFNTVHILNNNAAIIKFKRIEEVDMKDLQAVINTNFVGLVQCTKRAIKLMKENNHESHIINTNSIVGHKLPNTVLPDGTILHLNVYPATKYAITSFSEVLTKELLGGKIRVTSLSPGYVKTDIIGSDMTERFEKEENSLPFLNSEDIADAVAYVVGTPHHVQIAELIIKPLGEFL